RRDRFKRALLAGRGTACPATRSRRLRVAAERSGKGGAPDRRLKTLWRRAGAPPFPRERPAEDTCGLYNPGMSSPSSVAESPIADRRELIEYIAAGERARDDWRIGTEHEKFGFRFDDLRPPEFDGERGIEALLKGLVRFGWDPVEENGRVIALTRGDGASVTLEPAGQFELSGAQLRSIHE